MGAASGLGEIRRAGRGLSSRWTSARLTIHADLPVLEVLRRIGERTSASGAVQFLRQASPPRPEPRYRGLVYGYRVDVSEFAPSLGHDAFLPMLHADASPIGADATQLRGYIGLKLPIGLLKSLLIFFSAFLLLYEGLGVTAVVEGGWRNLVFPIAPFVFGGFAGTFVVSGRRSWERRAGELVEAICRDLSVRGAPARATWG